MKDLDLTKNEAKNHGYVTYPSMTVTDALDALKKIHTALGAGPYDRLSAVNAMGFGTVNGTSSTKVAALVHYGMLMRRGAGYQETELGTSLVRPMDEAEETRLLRQAFLSPNVFARVYGDFRDSALPNKLEVILSRQYRITEKASIAVAQYFRDSAEAVGLLRNGYLTDGPEENVPAERPETGQSQPKDESPARPSITGHAANTSTNSYPLELGGGITIIFPSDLMLSVATGAFTKGVAQLQADLQAVSGQGGENGEDKPAA